MKISYRTKEENNKAQEEEILNMSNADKFDSYLNFLVTSKAFLPNEEMQKKDNFVIKLYSE